MLLTVVLEKTLESPLDCKEIKSVNPKGNQSWIFIGRTDAEAEAPIRRPTDAKTQLTRKDPDGKEELTEDETVGWHQWLNGQVFEQALGDSEGQTPTTGFYKNTELLLFLFSYLAIHLYIDLPHTFN